MNMFFERADALIGKRNRYGEAPTEREAGSGESRRRQGEDEVFCIRNKAGVSCRDNVMRDLMILNAQNSEIIGGGVNYSLITLAYNLYLHSAARAAFQVAAPLCFLSTNV